MSERHGPDGESTLRTVRARADQFDAEQPRRFSGSAIAVPEIPEHIARPMSMVVGLGIGAVLLALCATSFVAMRSWAAIDRSGAVTAYALTAFFLFVAGAGCIIATLNHHLNVLKKDAPHHH
jgi:hypothetical protein